MLNFRPLLRVFRETLFAVLEDCLEVKVESVFVPYTLLNQVFVRALTPKFDLLAFKVDASREMTLLQSVFCSFNLCLISTESEVFLQLNLDFAESTF